MSARTRHTRATTAPTALWLALALTVGFPGPTRAAPPEVPESLAYQGLLLDGLGAPRTGSVDLVVRIWDALLGGTLVYKQSFASVPLADGVFSVVLGPTGEATDSPDDPLVTSLAMALGGDAGPSGPGRFLEVTVGTDSPLVRTQILASAYALRATSATTADTAATATMAQDVTAVGGVDPGYVAQFFQYFNPDGGPPNFDPSEGLADVDGDGQANFIDPDNDDDGMSDSTELARGSNINLVSPRVDSLAPNELHFLDSTTVTIQGLGFQPGLAVVFGSETPAPTSVTATSFDVVVGPQDIGPVDVTVTNPNGETDTAVGAFTFTPTIIPPNPPIAVPLAPDQTTFVAQLGTTVLALGGLHTYGVGSAVEAVFPLASEGASGQIAVAFDPGGAVAGLRCRDTTASDCAVEILVDADADRELEDESPLAVATASGATTQSLLSADLTTDPAGNWVAAWIQRTIGPTVRVAHDRNGDGDFADANELVTVESAIGNTGPVPHALAVDSAGRVAYAYGKAIGVELRLAFDLNGDGDFADTIGGNAEKATLGAMPSCLGATFDALDHLILVYGGGSGLTLARDANGDGDFADPGETQQLAAGGPTACDVDFVAGQPLTVLHNAGTAGVLHLLMDKNADGDFGDGGEDLDLGVTGGGESRLALNGVDRATVVTEDVLVVGPTD